MTSSAVHDDPPFFKCDSFSVRNHGRSVGFGRFTETTDSRLTTRFFVNSPFSVWKATTRVASASRFWAVRSGNGSRTQKAQKEPKKHKICAFCGLVPLQR